MGSACRMAFATPRCILDHQRLGGDRMRRDVVRQAAHSGHRQTGAHSDRRSVRDAAATGPANRTNLIQPFPHGRPFRSAYPTQPARGRRPARDHSGRGRRGDPRHGQAPRQRGHGGRCDRQMHLMVQDQPQRTAATWRGPLVGLDGYGHPSGIEPRRGGTPLSDLSATLHRNAGCGPSPPAVPQSRWRS